MLAQLLGHGLQALGVIRVDTREDLRRRAVALGFQLAQPLLVLRPLRDEERDVIEGG
jgi:hypothetical protein